MYLALHQNQSKRMGLVSNIMNDEKGTFYSDEKGTKKNDVDKTYLYKSACYGRDRFNNSFKAFRP